jgi:peptide/nickel transport system substrate-binding protein
MTDNELQIKWARELADQASRKLVTRREVLRKATVWGLSATTLGAVLAACGSDDTGDASSSASVDPATSTGTASSTASTPDGAKRGGVLAVGALTPSTEVDPVTGFDGASIAVFQLVNEYLVGLNADFTLRPQLAESWEPANDGAQWTVNLRPDVTFSDGSPLTADAVVATFERLLDPDVGSSAAQSAFNGILESGGITAADDLTVVFDLQRPYSDFPYVLSSSVYNTVILPADYDGGWIDNPVGTGPFLLESFSAAEGATFARNDNYWDPGAPLLDGVEIKFYADNQAQVLALQSGEVDTQVTSQIALLTPIENDPNFTIDRTEGTATNIFTLRTDTAPFDRKEVRQAIAWALDRDAINTTIANGTASLGNDHLFAPAFPTSPTDIPQRNVDIDKVAELLGDEEISFALTFEPPSRDLAVVIQEQLNQAGIEVELDERTSEEFYAGDQEVDTPWLFTPANLVGWASRAVPTQFVIPIVESDGVWNGSKYSNPELDAATEAYDAATDPAEKAAQAEIIAGILHEDVPIIIPFWSSFVRPFNSSKWAGISAHPSALELNTVSQV